MSETEFGEYNAPSKYVIVAPHAAGDDLHTGSLARALGRELFATQVINTKYVKPSNRNATNKPVCDFNKLPRMTGQTGKDREWSSG